MWKLTLAPVNKRQLRAAWVATVGNRDWPSSPGLSVTQQQEEWKRLLDQMKSMNLNAVILQVRPMADAFYPSSCNPWSKYLTGTQGKDPGYDPLAFLLKETHRRNLEFHAWFNPFRVSTDTRLESLVPDHPARRHPDWVVAYGGQLYYDPGIPEVRDHVIDSIVEVVNRYGIDAVHLDDYFYPYPVGNESFPDDGTYRRYGQQRFANQEDWRRDNVNRFICGLSKSIRQLKPKLKFGISPFGIWRNRTTDPTGSDTSGLQSFDELYVDTRTWIRQGWLDYVVPQIYWNLGYSPAAYEKLVNWWAGEVRGYPLHLYIGHAAYKIGQDNEAWDNPEEIANQLHENLLYPEVKGSVFFAISDLSRNPLGVRDRLATDFFRCPALVPSAPWLDQAPPPAPAIRSVKRIPEGVKIEWTDHSADTVYLVLYRFADGEAENREDPRNIRFLIRKKGSSSSVTDPTASPGKTWTYLLTAVDSLHNESPPSKTARLIPLYKVIAGSFQKLENAQARKSYLEQNGIEAAIVEIQVNGENRHRVQAGAFSQRSSAEARLEEIRKLGITDGFIVYE
ncbi:family 10 glycosylhydrolase [Kroppenstedtia guangzhouensis]|uniref:family 10 glycosylhydrolase n=1 Tax=Kroppenstedtia guangzhouensis TaxID=1274356 RepID=UPI001E4985E7|nr:family 10 glycosylhydrolase [Kroppenstedtia guangzhouensis]